MILVATTKGKNDEFQSFEISIHNTEQEAKEYCDFHTDSPMEEKYWTFSEIIEPHIEYEPSRYKNFK